MNTVAVLAGLGAAIAFAVGSALEQRGAKQEKLARPLDPRLLLRLLRRPKWLVAWIPEGIGTGLQALALGFGPLILVEPLLVSGLFLAIPLEALLNRRRVRSRDFAVVALGGAGLTGFLIAAQPRAGVREPSIADWLGVILWAAPVLATCLAVGWRSRNAARGALLGIATGLLYGITASLLKALTAQLATDPLRVFVHGQVYALILVGFSAVLLNQNALQSGRLAVPLTAIAILDATSSVAIGVSAFHEKISTDGPRLAVELAGALAMANGIWLASRTRSDARERQRSPGAHAPVPHPGSDANDKRSP